MAGNANSFRIRVQLQGKWQNLLVEKLKTDGHFDYFRVYSVDKIIVIKNNMPFLDQKKQKNRQPDWSLHHGSIDPGTKEKIIYEMSRRVKRQLISGM